jgi:hypothetical protein
LPLLVDKRNRSLQDCNADLTRRNGGTPGIRAVVLGVPVTPSKD